jgi:quinoprotein glucose dehydrogenase
LTHSILTRILQAYQFNTLQTPNGPCLDEQSNLNFTCMFLRTLSSIFVSIFACLGHAQNTDWPVYRGNAAATQHSPLTQINRENVDQLEVAWTYRTGDAGDKTMIQCNPLVIDGILYGTSPKLSVFALDAATGEEIWRYDPVTGNSISGVSRGLSYWSNGSESRVLFTSEHHLVCLDAENGQPIASFGQFGKVDLRRNLKYPPETLSLSATSPGIVHENLIILGSSTGEGYNASPGYVRAYDVIDGQLEWVFYTIPQPGQPGYETWNWQEGERYGGANVWGGLSIDESRGWVFLAVGSPTYDFYGANRIGENLYGNCIVALDASTGEYIWHYQMLHHDLWDYDPPCAPSLATIPIEGVPTEAVIQPTKMGYLVVLDRETGKPLWPMEERRVPASYIPGEEAWPTQPYPVKGFFTRQSLGESDLRTFSTGAKEDAYEEYRKYRYWGRFTPPSIEGSLAFPSTWGGALWGGASVDPIRNTLYVNANELASINRLRPVILHEEVGQLYDAPSAEPNAMLGRSLYALNCTACHGADRQGIPPAFPGLAGIEGRLSHEDIGSIIRNGKAAMPAFAQFSDTQLNSLVAYLENADELPALEDSNLEGKSRYVLAGYAKFIDSKGFPLTAPPWGSLTAIDLATGDQKWRIPLGEVEELTAKGIPKTGDRNFGGCISTASGLVFIAASTDEKFRALDSDSGVELWQAKLPAGGYAVPSTYELDGRQYLVIAAGGGGRGATPSGDSYVCFALPE